MSTQQIIQRYTDAQPGDRVTVAGFTHGTGTFTEWGRPEWSCLETHIVSPGLRIAIVEMDRYGRQPIWENKLTRVES